MSDAPQIRRLTGVYHADGGLLGELRYVVGKLRGTAHCALCDLTHGGVRKKASFCALEDRLPVPVKLVHLNERSEEVARFTDGRTACVIAHTDQGLVMLLDPQQLELGGSVDAFQQALQTAVEREGLRWPDGPAKAPAQSTSLP